MYTSRKLFGKSVSVLTMIAVGFSALVLPFTYAAMVHAVSAPTITSISPESGPSSGGTAITVTGTGFDTGATLKIGANYATSVAVVSSTTITAVSPSGGVGLQDVVIDNPDTGNAILIEGFEFLAPSSSPEPTTVAASLITSTDATLNGTNGTSAATDSMFWVGTSTFSTASDTPPAGVYSSGSLGARAAGENFSLSLFAIDGLPMVTADTTYYFTVWTKVDGTWYPGNVLSFTTLSESSGSSAPTTVAASGITSSGATLNAVNGTSAATGNMFWVATSTFSTASSTPPEGVHITGNFGALDANESFSTTLSAITSLYPVTANTTYYFAPWVEIDGVWIPGAVMSFTTSAEAGSPTPTTVAASGITSTGATLNGMNGAEAATGYKFWVSTSTFSTASATPPAGVHTTGDFGALDANESFSAPLSACLDLTIMPSTTYYYAAWVQVDGVWIPGAVMSFTTSASSSGGSSSGGEITGDSTGGVEANGSLAVTGITVEKGTAIADGTFANGWRYVFNVTVPADETNVAMKFGNWFNSTASTTIAAANNFRISSAQADNGGATVLITAANTYSTPALHITGDMNSTMAGKQVQIVVEAAVPSGTVNGSYTTNYGVQTLP